MKTNIEEQEVIYDEMPEENEEFGQDEIVTKDAEVIDEEDELGDDEDDLADEPLIDEDDEDDDL